jgi:signal transduction histidine kinase
MCRDYPRNLLYQAAPAMLPGCGYRPVAANAAGLRAALESEPLTDEQRARLARDLHLY